MKSGSPVQMVQVNARSIIPAFSSMKALSFWIHAVLHWNGSSRISRILHPSFRLAVAETKVSFLAMLNQVPLHKEFDPESCLAPELKTPVPISRPPETKCKISTISDEDSTSMPGQKKTNQARGQNWNVDDSLLFVQALEWAERNKKDIAVANTVLIKASETCH